MRQEWGPKQGFPIPDRRRLKDVTTFGGHQLESIQRRVTDYLVAHPGDEQTPDDTRTREAVLSLSSTEGNARRLENGLAVINQLAVIGKSPTDVREVSVRKDPTNPNDYWYYDIAWKYEVKPVTENNIPTPQKKPEISLKVRRAYEKLKSEGVFRTTIEPDGTVATYRCLRGKAERIDLTTGRVISNDQYFPQIVPQPFLALVQEDEEKIKRELPNQLNILLIP